jgi:alkane 1-monooxygenase
MLSFAPPLIPIPSYVLYLVTGSTLTTLTPFFFIFGLIPLLDALIREDRNNPLAEVIASMEADPYYLLLAGAAVPLLWLSFVAAVAFVGPQQLPWWSYVFLTLGVGTTQMGQDSLRRVEHQFLVVYSLPGIV